MILHAWAMNLGLPHINNNATVTQNYTQTFFPTENFAVQIFIIYIIMNVWEWNCECRFFSHKSATKISFSQNEDEFRIRNLVNLQQETCTLKKASLCCWYKIHIRYSHINMYVYKYICIAHLFDEKIRAQCWYWSWKLYILYSVIMYLYENYIKLKYESVSVYS